METIDEKYYLNVGEVMETIPSDLTSTQQKFIDLYNNTNLPMRKIRSKLGMTQSQCRETYVSVKPYLHLRKFGNHRKRNRKFEPNNYSYHCLSNSYQVRKNGKYYGSVKTEAMAKRMVELFQECNWDMNKRVEVKKQVLKECRT